MSQPRDHHVTLNGIRFHYLEWGDPQAPPVVLLHGLSGNACEWQPVAERLRFRHHVLALNQRGHGASGWADSYDVRALTTDLEGFVDALGLDTIRLAGHSMGATVGLHYAAEHPDAVTALGVVDMGPAAPANLQQGWPEMLAAFAAAEYTDPSEPFEMWKQMDPLAQEDPLRHFITHSLRHDDDGLWRWRLDAGHVYDFLDKFPSEERMWEIVGLVRCPTRIIRGAESGVLASDTAKRMVAEMTSADLVELAGAGHDLTVEAPDGLTNALDEFFQAH